MKKYLIIALVLIAALIVTVVLIRQPGTPSGPVPDLDAAAIETSKNLHPPKLNP